MARREAYSLHLSGFENDCQDLPAVDSKHTLSFSVGASMPLTKGVAMGLKERIRAGETVLGVSMPSKVSREEFEAALGDRTYDFVCTDSQHQPLNEETLVRFCQIAAEFKLPVRFRVPHTRQAYLTGHYMDLGPSGVEVPQVEEPATVDEILESFYYPPVGKRSFGGMSRLNWEVYPKPESYAEWWNGYGIIWIQVESSAAVGNAHVFARPGIDCVAFGPTDLGFDLHLYPHPWLKSVEDCVRQVVRSLEGTQTGVCMRSTPEKQSLFADLGVNVHLFPAGS